MTCPVYVLESKWTNVYDKIRNIFDVQIHQMQHTVTVIWEEEQKYLPSFYSINIGSDCAVTISEVTAKY
jgi:hypothetical protein